MLGFRFLVKLPFESPKLLLRAFFFDYPKKITNMIILDCMKKTTLVFLYGVGRKKGHTPGETTGDDPPACL
jgi:hypothetical protein